MKIMKRSRDRKKAHDKCVEILANEERNGERTVEADLQGWNKPPKINGYIPDIKSTIGNMTRIYEIETEETLHAEEDKKQQTAFRKYAEENEGVWFWLYLADDEGRCQYQGAWYEKT